MWTPEQRMPEANLHHFGFRPTGFLAKFVSTITDLFAVAEPTDQWEEEFNPESEVVYPKAIICARSGGSQGREQVAIQHGSSV
jgi:hypothetical protein